MSETWDGMFKAGKEAGRRELAGLLAKWKRRAHLFHEAYKEKNFQAFALNIQKTQLEAYGADKVLPMQNESLRQKLLECARERNVLREACRRLITNLDNGKPLTGAFEQIREALKTDKWPCGSGEHDDCIGVVDNAIEGVYAECLCPCHKKAI